jgi:predicted TIM-barrel fold metal-dependent hydrolase
MDKAGVATAISSITAPGVAFADQELGRKLARECNEYAAKLVQDYPGRFGIFAMLPLTDIDGSLAELAYSLDILKADGVALFTSYGNKWLGDPAFALVLEELNRRNAIVYTHPRTAACCVNLIPNVPDTVVEYGADTSRAIASLVFSGAAHKYPNIKFIFSHAGGTMPFLLERFTRLPLIEKNVQLMVPDGVLPELQRFYYDTAWSMHPPALAALLKAVPVAQVLFGSDYPFRTCTDTVKGLTAFGLDEKDLRAIERDNALRLMPRYA